MADNISIATVSTCIIRPSTPTPPQHMFLTAADLVFRRFHHFRRILFFNLQPLISSSYHSIVSHLKSSLALALVDFFPWAGRLFEREEDGRLTLDCNDAGVPFTEASIDLPFSCVEDDGYKHQPIHDLFAPPGEFDKLTGPDFPLLSIQVTRFQGDEGFILGFGHSHVVADGMSLWHFMKSWGECARGVPLSMHPVHAREELRAEKLILPPPQDGVDRSPRSSELSDNNMMELELVQRDFRFSGEVVRRLKQLANETAPARGSRPETISSLQALSAHMWRRVVEAGCNKSKDDVQLLQAEGMKSKEIVLNVVANMRGRLVPPLPEGYFGNAVVRRGAVAKEGEVRGERLGETAVRVQEVIKTMDDGFGRRLWGQVEAWPWSTSKQLLPQDVPTLQVGGSPRLPMYEVDFGWGPPLCVRSPRIPANGLMFLSPTPQGGGSVDISVSLPTPIMNRLVQDENLFSI